MPYGTNEMIEELEKTIQERDELIAKQNIEIVKSEQKRQDMSDFLHHAPYPYNLDQLIKLG